MQLPSQFSFSAPVNIVSGARALEHLPFEIDALGARRPLLLCGRRLSAGRRRRIVGGFNDSGMALALFENLPDDLDDAVVGRIARLYRQRGRDCIVACGGGVAADAAKLLSAVIGAGVDTVAELPRHPAVTRAGRPVTVQLIFGELDGTETAPWVTRRPAMAADDLQPQLALVDPRLTGRGDTLAAAGTAALVLAVESLLDETPNPFTAVYARCVLETAARHLPAAAGGRVDAEAGHALANAVVLAGCAAANARQCWTGRLGMVAARFCPVSTGRLMGILLPHALERRLGWPEGTRLDLVLPLLGADMAAACDDSRRHALSLRAVAELLDRVLAGTGKGPFGARTLADAGIAEAQLAEIAAQAAAGVGDDDGVSADSLLAVLEGAL